MRGLLHDVAELSGQRERAFAFHGGGFDEQDVAADRRPRESCGDADLIALEQFVLEDFRPAEKLIQIVGVDLADLLFSGGDLPRNLAADGGDLPLEVSQSGFLRVQIDDRAHAFIGELNLVLCQAVLGNLFRDQVPLGDFELFLFGVTGELDDFHAIPKRRLNRIQHVRCRDEHDV